jgi:Tfp pilus assembly protein PilN
MRAINLLPRDDARRKQQKPQWVVFVPVILAVLLSALLSMLFLSASGKVKDRKATLASLQAELAAIPTPDASKVQTQNALAADKQTRVHALNTALSRRVVWDRVFRELSLVLPDDVWLSTLAARSPVSPSLAVAPAPVTGAVAATECTLAGYTYSQPAVARLLTRLSVIPDLVNVQLQQSTLTKVGNAPAVHFTIVADVRSPGGSS